MLTLSYHISLCFLHAEWGADVDAYVVDTNYDEYAIVMLSKQKTGGEKTKSAKLYSECHSSVIYFTSHH